MLERRPEEVIRIAVKGMLPRNRLARKQITKLKVYAGPEHPHVAQKPQPMEIHVLMADETPHARRAASPRRPRRAAAAEEPPPRRRPPPSRRRGARRRGGPSPRRGAALPADAEPAAERPRRPPTRRRRARAPRVKPAIPGADLEVDIVARGRASAARRALRDDDEDGERESPASDEDDVVDEQPVAATIDLAADARYQRDRQAQDRRRPRDPQARAPAPTRSTASRSTTYFPRPTLQRNIRQPLEAVGYEERMDVVARMHGGGVSSQAGALRHGISRALLEADPNLRGELKRRGFLTRDSRVKERKKAGLKKARKRPQFTKR